MGILGMEFVSLNGLPQYPEFGGVLGEAQWVKENSKMESGPWVGGTQKCNYQGAIE